MECGLVIGEWFIVMLLEGFVLYVNYVFNDDVISIFVDLFWIVLLIWII